MGVYIVFDENQYNIAQAIVYNHFFLISKIH